MVNHSIFSRELLAGLLVSLTILSTFEALAGTHNYNQSDSRGINVIAPERGFYKYYRQNKYGYPEYVDLTKDRDYSWVRNSGFSLIAARVSLEQYRDRSIPESYILQLEAGFEAVRSAGIKVILRFNYNNGSNPGEDASLSWILRHISQLENVLQRNADVIAVIQAGFIGAWGEWHSSKHGLDSTESRKAVLQALLDVLPQNRSVQLRYPQHKEDLFGPPLRESLAFNGSKAARVGHHNDCLFASENDLTYPLRHIQHYSDYVATEGSFVPVGGETCKVYPPRTNCATARSELRRLHYSYLNDNYLQEVVDGWKREGCYEEIASHLGYHLVLRQATYNEAAYAGTEFPIELAVENKGWAAPFNPRVLLVTIESSQGARVTAQITPDVRMIRPGVPTILKGTLQLPQGMKGGRYVLYLSAPDPAPNLQSRYEYALPFFNEGYLGKEARLPLGHIEVMSQ